MKNLIKVLTAVSIFAVINCPAQLSFAQKHSKRTHSDNVNSYMPTNHSNYISNSDEGKWKFGADFGLTYGVASSTITGTTDPLMTMLSSMSGFSPSLNTYADYSATESIGIQAKFGWERINGSTSSDYTTEEAKVNSAVSTGQSYIDIGISLRYDVNKNVFLTAGPRVYLPVGSRTVIQDDKILTPGITFGDGTQSRHEETLIQTSKSTFGLEIGGGYRFNFSNSVAFVPRASFQFFPASGSPTAIQAGGQVSPSSAIRFQFSAGIMAGL